MEKKITRKQLEKIASLSGGRAEVGGHIAISGADSYRIGQAARKVLGQTMAFHLAGCAERNEEIISFPGWSLSND